MTYQQPLRPDEDVYRTDQVNADVAASGDPLEPESPSAGRDSRGWLFVAIVLLVVFVGAIVWAVALPLLS